MFGVNTDANTGGENFFEGGALSTSSRFLDLDPNNIQNVNVLKGLAATTMYGEQGRNGVVLITTKSGSFGEDREAGFDITLNQSVFANEIASLLITKISMAAVSTRTSDISSVTGGLTSRARNLRTLALSGDI
ncbi:MAG: hypothetical protein U5K69_06155 [Balneolaceae bacterium]|nr:hypothetical protein [Balneolaceae bacterium]